MRSIVVKELLKDPLTHFVIIGGLVFAVFRFVGSAGDPDPRVIVVDRPALLTFVQYRTKAFEPGVAAARLDGMTPAQLKTVVDDYVREEVLHREAIAMGLDVDDYIIRRRLVQKVEFVAEGFAASAPPLSDAQLRRYFDDNSADYYAAPTVTFAHVFVDARSRSPDQAWKVARQMLTTLRTEAAAFPDATRYGDRFPYLVNYVERERDEVASHFGAEMADVIFALPALPGEWQGPIRSDHGVHLVMLTASVAGRLPEFDEVRERVVGDAERESLRLRQDQTLQAIVDSYQVDIDLRRRPG